MKVFRGRLQQDILTDLDERNEESMIPNVKLGEQNNDSATVQRLLGQDQN